MKKTISLLCLLLVISLFVGCSSKKKSPLDPKNPTHVTIWNYYNGDQLAAFQTLVDEFNTTIGAKEGIVVEQISQGDINTLADNLINSVSGKVGADNIPSAAALYSETAYILYQEGAIVSLDEYFTESELSEYVDSFIEEGRLTEGGKVYILPVSKSTEAFIVNTTDWEEFGKVSGISADSIETNEQLVQAAQAYYEWCGKALYGRDSVSNYVYISANQLGHQIFTVDKDGNLIIDLDRDTFKKIWDNYYVPFVKGYFGQSNKYRSEDIKRGVILAMTGSTSGVTYIPTAVVDNDDTSHDVDILIKKSLSFENAAENVYVQQGAGYCVMKTNEAEEYATSQFLKWFTSTEQNIEFSVSSGYSPVKKEANNAAKIEEVFTVDSAKSQNMLDALLISADIYSNEKTYTSKPFIGSKEVRTILGDALEKTSINDRQKVVEAMNKGESWEQATAYYLTDEYFDAWFDNLCNEVNNVVNE